MKSAETIYLKILRYGIYASLFTPLVVFKDFLSPFHFGKGVVFRSIIEVLAMFYVLLIISYPRYRPNWKNPLILSFTIFTGIFILTSFTGVNLYRSFYGMIERMGGMFSFIHFWIFFIILTGVFKTRDEWMRLLKLSVFIGLASAIYALGQHLDVKGALGYQKERVIGTMGNPALYAGYMLFVVFISFYFFLSSVASGIKKKIDLIGLAFYGGVFLFGSYTIFLTAVRGSVGAWIVAMFIITIYLVLTSKTPAIRKTGIFLLASLIILGSLFWALKNSNFIQNNVYLQRIAKTSLSTPTVQTRLMAWGSALEGWKEKFWFGWGPENFSDLFAKYFNPELFIKPGSEVVWDRAHNEFLNAGATMGIFGFLSYISLFVVALWLIIKKFPNKDSADPFLKISFAIIIIAYMIHNSFILDTIGNYVMFFLTLGFIYFISSAKIETGETKTEVLGQQAAVTEPKLRPNLFLTGVLLAIAGFIIYQYNIKPAQANYATTRGIVVAAKGDYTQSLKYYKKALGFNAPAGQYEIRQRLAEFVVNKIGGMKLGTDEKTRKGALAAFQFTASELEKNIAQYPLDPSPYMYLMRVYTITSVKFDTPVVTTERIEDVIAKALEISPTRQQIYYEAAQIYLHREEYDKAISLFEKARDLEPSVAISYWYLGMGLSEGGRYKEAKDNVEKAIKMGYSYTDDFDDIARASQIYVKLKDVAGLISYYEYTIKKLSEPEGFDVKNLKDEQKKNFAQIHASLASAYKAIGNFEKAKFYAKRAGEISEQFKPEAEAFIKALR